MSKKPEILKQIASVAKEEGLDISNYPNINAEIEKNKGINPVFWGILAIVIGLVVYYIYSKNRRHVKKK